jgi:flagellar protein FliO/FliZ
MTATHTAQATTGTLGNDAVVGLAVIGKTVFALALVLGFILLCAWLARRVSPALHGDGHWLRIIASRAVGPKERVVVVAVQDTWLVLGVAAGQVSKLHELPAPAGTPSPDTAEQGFASRFARALRAQTRQTFSPRRDA